MVFGQVLSYRLLGDERYLAFSFIKMPIYSSCALGLKSLFETKEKQREGEKEGDCEES